MALLVRGGAEAFRAAVRWRHPDHPLAFMRASTTRRGALVVDAPGAPEAVHRTRRSVARLVLGRSAHTEVATMRRRHLLIPRPAGDTAATGLRTERPQRPVAELAVHRAGNHVAALAILELRIHTVLATTQRLPF